MRYDIDTLKAEIDCRTFAGQFTQLEEKNDRESAGPCPICGGTDRFNAQKQRWLCRHCTTGQWRDVVHLAALIWQLDTKADFKTICERLGAGQLVSSQLSSRQLDNWKPTDDSPPPAEWQSQVMGIVTHCHELLFSPVGEKARQWLNARGLNDDTLRHFQVGYNPVPKAWIDGRCIYGGIVIPHLQRSAGVLWGVKIRLSQQAKPIWLADHPKWKKAAPKYTGVTGSKQNLFNCDILAGQQYAFVTEGEFDAMLLTQEMGDLAAVITLGGYSGKLGDRWLPTLLPIKRFFLSLDSDASGQLGLSYWQELTGKRGHVASVPSGKDITEFWQSGGDLKAWSTEFLPAFVSPLTTGVDLALFFDGASKDELPTYGWLISDGDSTIQEGSGQAVGTTGNTAEYSGLIAGLKAIMELSGVRSLTIKGDSQLVIFQISGEWRVKNKDLKPLHREAMELIEAIRSRGIEIKIEWIDRKDNKQADKLSKAARDNAAPDESHTWPLTMLWPAGTPTTAVGDTWTILLDTGEIRVTYHNKAELERAVYNVEILKEAVGLGGVVVRE